MSEAVVKLVVDLGNSETRVATILDKGDGAGSQIDIAVLDNRFSSIPQNNVDEYVDHVNKPENAGKSSIFWLSGNIYCSGELASVEFAQTSYRPSALEKKYESIASRVALMNAFRYGYLKASEFFGVSVDELNPKWIVSVLLPPEDVALGAGKMAEMVKKIERIDFLTPSLRKRVLVDRVTILPEGFCAFIGVLYKRKGVIRSDYKFLREGGTNTLICDIGAGTTDFLLIHDGRVVETSKFTKGIGGNNITRIVQKKLRGQGISLSDSMIQKGCLEGKIRVGSKDREIYMEIEEAKKEVSRNLVDSVQEFFESTMIPVNSINYVLIVGGGAAGSDNPYITPISTYIKQYMRNIAPNVEEVELPVVEMFGGAERISPRMLNIIGATVLSE